MHYLKSYAYLPSLKAMVNAVATVVQGNLIKMERYNFKELTYSSAVKMWWEWIHSGLLRCRSGKEYACQCMRHKRRGFHPWVRKIYWSRKWQPTPVFLPGKLHGQRSLAGYIVHEVAKNWTQRSDWVHTHGLTVGSWYNSSSYHLQWSQRLNLKSLLGFVAMGEPLLKAWNIWRIFRFLKKKSVSIKSKKRIRSIVNPNFYAQCIYSRFSDVWAPPTPTSLPSSSQLSALRNKEVKTLSFCIH